MTQWAAMDRPDKAFTVTETLNGTPPTSPAAVDTKSDARSSTGMLYSLPQVVSAEELVARGVRMAKKVGRNKKLQGQGPSAQARNLAARQMDTLMKELTTPLNRYLKGFPLVQKLHRFEAALLELTVSEERYYKVLAKVLQLRKTATAMGKEYASRGAKAISKKEAERLSQEGFAALESLFVKNRGVLMDLVDVTRKLRQLPKLELGIPTVALVGAPNVGKSSLVQAISSGRPEICNYPFTTRSIKMGHFYVEARRYQVTDTPGLLNRPEEEKNALELLTMATLRHLPTSVVFVLDATEECGSSLDDQFAIRAQLKEAFASKHWIDVFSKADLLQEAILAAQGEAISSQNASPTDKFSKQVLAMQRLDDSIKLSTVSNEGMDLFKRRLIQILTTAPLSDQSL